MLVFVVVVTFVCAVAFQVGQGVDLDYFRGAVNEDRGSADAETAIALSLGDGLIGSALSCLLVLATLLIPVPLLLTGNPLHAVFFVLIVTMWTWVGRAVWARLRETAGVIGDVRWMRCFALVVSFVLVQSFFEPDYGSYLRHLSPMLPAAIYVASRTAMRRDAGSEATGGRHSEVA